MFVPIPLVEFLSSTAIDAGKHHSLFNGVKHVVSLRDITNIDHVGIMPRDYLQNLLANVPLQTGEKVYEGLEVSLERVDPNGLRIGQTFVLRRKYQSILEDFSDRFNDFCVTRGPAKCNAMIVIGGTKYNSVGIAHYLPPIIEEHPHHRILLDGIHRNFLVKQIGTTLEAIVVHKVKTQFPADPQHWRSIKVVDEKPANQQRYFNLQPSLFRLLHAVGIDG